MYSCTRKSLPYLLYAVFIMAGLLTTLYKTLLPNVIVLNNGAPPASVELDHRRDDGTWQKTIEKTVAALKKSIEALWCDTKQVQSNGGFCVTEQQMLIGGNHVFDPKLCSAVESLAGKGSIGDLGAGLGWYGMCLLRTKDVPFVVNPKLKAEFSQHYITTMGAMYNTPKVVSSWHGFDGAGNIEELSGGFVRQADLSEENLWLGRQWDWVISVEVGEHISAAHEKDFLDNVVRHACKGVLLTWAVEGQGGHSHINERNNDYIKTRMEERGLVNDEQEDKKIRAQVVLGWLKNTVMVFRFQEEKKCIRQ